MKFSYSKKRSINSRKEYIGSFDDKSRLQLEIKWIIDEKEVLSQFYDFPIFNSKINWVSIFIDNEIKNYFDKALKLIAFG